MKDEWLDVPIMTPLFRLWGVQVRGEITKELKKKVQDTLYKGLCTAKIKVYLHALFIISIVNGFRSMIFTGERLSNSSCYPN